MSALAEPVTFETDRWRLSLPVGWRHEPTNDEEGFSVASEDGSKKIFVRILLPRPDSPPDTHDTVTLYETAITTAHEKTLNPSHRRFITEHGSQPPFSTLLLASYDADAHFGIATVAFIAPDHRLYLSVHDYWSEDRDSFETFFKDIVQRFAPIHTQA